MDEAQDCALKELFAVVDAGQILTDPADTPDRLQGRLSTCRDVSIVFPQIPSLCFYHCTAPIRTVNGLLIISDQLRE